MSDDKYKTEFADLQILEDTEAQEDVSDACDISEIIAVSEAPAEPAAKKAKKKKDRTPRKKGRAFAVAAFIFFLLTLIFAGYLFGLHYNLFPDFLAPYIDKAIPSADIIPERYQVRTFEMLYSPQVPDAYTELMLMRKTDSGTEGYLAYAFTNSEGEVEFRAYARRTVTEYSLVTDTLPSDVTEHNNKQVSRVKDNDGEIVLAVYTDETTVISVEEGFVRIDIESQKSDTEDRYYDYKIINEEEFYAPEQEDLGKCRVSEIPAGYVPDGAEGIEAVEDYTSLFRIPVSVYTDRDGAFDTYYVYYIYGDFNGEETGFYPATENGSVIPGGLRNETLTLKEASQAH